LRAHKVQVLSIAFLLEHIEEEVFARAYPPAKIRTADVSEVINLVFVADNLAVNFEPGLLGAALD
jgi:hypothetical protein